MRTRADSYRSRCQRPECRSALIRSEEQHFPEESRWVEPSLLLLPGTLLREETLKALTAPCSVAVSRRLRTFRRAACFEALLRGRGLCPADEYASSADLPFLCLHGFFPLQGDAPARSSLFLESRSLPRAVPFPDFHRERSGSGEDHLRGTNDPISLASVLWTVDTMVSRVGPLVCANGAVLLRIDRSDPKIASHECERVISAFLGSSPPDGGRCRGEVVRRLSGPESDPTFLILRSCSGARRLAAPCCCAGAW